MFCDVSSATNERTAISCIVPLAGLTRSLPAIYLDSRNSLEALLLAVTLSSYPLDYLAQLKVSSNHLTQGILESLPIPSQTAVNGFASLLGGMPWIQDRGLELTYTAWDLEVSAELRLVRPAVPLGRGAPLSAPLRVGRRLLPPLPRLRRGMA